MPSLVKIVDLKIKDLIDRLGKMDDGKCVYIHDLTILQVNELRKELDKERYSISEPVEDIYEAILNETGEQKYFILIDKIGEIKHA